VAVAVDEGAGARQDHLRGRCAGAASCCSN
jgi:hypothetical protein